MVSPAVQYRQGDTMARLNGGDKLASGGVKATFGPVEKVSDKKWAEAFDDFDPSQYYRDTLLLKNRNAGIGPREATKR
jgi:hypothetical protein